MSAAKSPGMVVICRAMLALPAVPAPRAIIAMIAARNACPCRQFSPPFGKAELVENSDELQHKDVAAARDCACRRLGGSGGLESRARRRNLLCDRRSRRLPAWRDRWRAGGHHLRCQL